MKETGNVFLVGPMGAGKTTVGRLLSEELRLRFFDSDHEIENSANASISWIFDVEGERGFRVREARMIASLVERPGIVLATGGGAVMDPETRKLLKSRGIVVYLFATLEQQLSRKLKDKNRPLLRTANREQRIRELFELRHPIYRDLADIRVEVKRRYPRMVCRAIKRELDEFRLRRAATS